MRIPEPPTPKGQVAAEAWGRGETGGLEPVKLRFTSSSHMCATWGGHAISSSLNFLMRHGDDRTQFPDSWEDSVAVPDATQASTQTFRHPNGGGALFSLAPCRRAVGNGAFPRWVTLPSPPPEHSLPQKAYPNVAPGLTQLIALPHRT